MLESKADIESGNRLVDTENRRSRDKVDKIMLGIKIGLIGFELLCYFLRWLRKGRGEDTSEREEVWWMRRWRERSLDCLHAKKHD